MHKTYIRDEHMCLTPYVYLEEAGAKWICAICGQVWEVVKVVIVHDTEVLEWRRVR